MGIRDWSSYVCSSDLRWGGERAGAALKQKPQSSQFDLAHFVAAGAQRLDQPVEMLRVARLAFDIGDQPLGGQRREYALAIDFDDVGALLNGNPRDLVRGGRVSLEPDTAHVQPARTLQIKTEKRGVGKKRG